MIRVTGVSADCIPFINVLAVAQEIVANTEAASLPFAPPAISSYLPSTLPLAHASCFSVLDDLILTFDELSRRFTDSDDAATRLRAWEWQTSAYREFSSAAPPAGATGWIDLSVHRFATSRSTEEALSYFVDARAADTGLAPSSAPLLGDRAAALSGQPSMAMNSRST